MAIVSPLFIVTEDGTTLTGSSDVEVARKWAEHVYGPEWATTPFGEQSEAVAIALQKIRAEFGDN